jgi:ABC-type antimicrobial peptide transport system permease subunit
VTALKIAHQAGRTMRRYWGRTVLMMAGIVVGISSLVVLSSVGEATKHETMKRFKNMLGTFDTIIVRPGGGRSRGMPTLVNVPPTLKFEDSAAIANDLPEIKTVALAQDAFDIDVKYRDHSASPLIFGVSSNWLKLRSDEVEDGDFFTEEQNSSLARVAVLGLDARNSLFPGEDPIGKTIRIADVPFQVIGLLKSRGAGPGGASLDNVILIPVNTSARRLFNRDYLTMLIAQVRDPAQSTQATNKIAALLRERHHINGTALDDFTVTNPAATMAQVTRASNLLTKILTGVSIMALLIGGVVIMSLMSIAVSERTKEIGVRRSVGAEQADILLQFALEAVLVTTLGGAAGVVIGWSGAQVVTRIQKLPSLLSLEPLLIAGAVSMAVGLVFGIYPAWKASRVDPNRALHS